MSRYFVTTNASLPYQAGGIGFQFEPIAKRGGSWLGVLAVDDSAASILLEANFPQVAEITAERYESEKKKLAPTPTNSPAFPRKPAVPGVAGVVGQSSGPGAKGADPAKDPNSTAFLTSVTLFGITELPPHEPLLEESVKRRPKGVK